MDKPFDFVPHFFIVCTDPIGRNIDYQIRWLGTPNPANIGVNEALAISVSGNTISWWFNALITGTPAMMQCNSSGTLYYYIAIG